MDRLRQQYQQLQQQLAGLNASQKMLVAALVAIMAMTVVWWGRYAATSEMVALLDQPMSGEHMSAIRANLATHNIPYQIEGDRILVPPERRYDALAILSYDQALPSDTTSAFDKLLSSMSTFDSSSKTELLKTRAIQEELVQILRRQPGVRDANVIINGQYRRQIGGNMLPSASVALTMQSSTRPDRKLVDAVAGMVAGAVPMLTPDRVNLMIDGHPYTAADPASGALVGGSTYLELLDQAERYYQTKVQNAFRFIPGLQVSVNVDINSATTKTIENKIDPDSKINMPLRQSEEREESRGGAGGGAEAGAMPNIALAVANQGPSGSEKTRESSESEFMADYNKTRSETFNPAGDFKPTGCQISIPLSYVVTSWRDANRTTEDPTAEQLAVYQQAIERNVHQGVLRSLNLDDENSIFVLTYADPFPEAQEAQAASTALASAGGMGDLVSRYGKEIAVSVLAAVSLFMVSMMVRRTTPPPAPAPMPRHEPMLGHLGGGIDVAGEVGEADNMLLAHEVDDEQMEMRHMVEQVETLVKENPDAAAQLVKRWLTHV